MLRNIMLIPIGIDVKLTNTIISLTHVIKKNNIKLNIFKPIHNSCNHIQTYNNFTKLIYKNFNIPVIDSFEIIDMESLISSKQKNQLIKRILSKYNYLSKITELILIEGLEQIEDNQFININNKINYELAKNLNAEIIFIISINKNLSENFNKYIKILLNDFGGIENKNIIGIIIDKLNYKINQIKFYPNYIKKIINNDLDLTKLFNKDIKSNIDVPIIGCINWNNTLLSISINDIVYQLNLNLINTEKQLSSKIKSVFIFIKDFSKLPKKIFPKFCLLVIPASYFQGFIEYCSLIKLNLKNISAIILTDNNFNKKNIIKLCNNEIISKIPILTTKNNILTILFKLKNINFEKQIYKKSFLNKVKKYMLNCINLTWLNTRLKFKNNFTKQALSPLIFLNNITEISRQHFKRIILPEGNEPRIIQAASFCEKNKIAKCILLGNPKEIQQLAKDKNIDLNKKLEIIDPTTIRENYILRLLELRKNHNMNQIRAQEALNDNVMLGTMMLDNNEIDGLVSGAVNTTANTIRPALQIIKTAKNTSLVSSIFFMLLEDQVLVYADCAINQNPNSEQLSEIAIQSADSAKYFGINPYIAMLSYSTGNSGFGPDIEKVIKATYLVQEKRPDLFVDGPLQYDAAIIKDVAKSKAPHSKVAGKATIFIFPDLNSGNITYKAVQRSANIISIGPILQGMRKPVNDLSRGALIDDIIYTIAITGIQASQII